MIAEFDKENTGTITFDGFLGEKKKMIDTRSPCKIHAIAMLYM